jgi:O-antigen ligase
MGKFTRRISRIALSICIFVLVLVQLLLTSAGGSVGLYIFAGILAMITLVFSRSNSARVVSALCLATAMGLAIADYRAGLGLQNQLNRVRESTAATRAN